MLDQSVDRMFLFIGVLVTIATISLVGIVGLDYYEMYSAESQEAVVTNKYVSTVEDNGQYAFLPVGKMMAPMRIGGGNETEYGLLLGEEAYVVTNGEYNQVSIGDTVTYRATDAGNITIDAVASADDVKTE